MSGDLIDTTEMYLRTVFELEEEGITPLRARIAERLGHRGPTVSQTVARMERDGLVTVAGDRHLELTPTGRDYATRVMRKHRLAEWLLVDVIGIRLEDVHAEACRWEHVMSETVERRLVELLDTPRVLTVRQSDSRAWRTHTRIRGWAGFGGAGSQRGPATSRSHRWSVSPPPGWCAASRNRSRSMPS